MACPRSDDEEASHFTKNSPYQHHWTEEQRAILAILKEGYRNCSNDIVQVFNGFYKDALPNIRGLKKETLAVQWYDIKNRRRNFDFEATLQAMIISPQSNFVSEDALLQSIENKASDLGIQLIRKSDQITPFTCVTNELQLKPKRKREASKDRDGERPSIGVSENLYLSAPETPKVSTPGFLTPPNSARLPCRSRNSILQALNSSCKLRKTSQKLASNQLRSTLPLLGFRGFSELSQGHNSPQGFVAGAFTHEARVPPCPDDLDPQYRRDAILHVAKSKAQPSPFISLTKNPIRAIMVASTMQKKCTAYLAVFDLHKLNEERILKDAKSLELEPDVSVKYHSGGEYLIFGQIKPSAIISVIPISQLIDTPPAILGDPDPFGIAIISKQAWSGLWAKIQLSKDRLCMSYQAGIGVGIVCRTFGLPSKYLPACVDTILLEWNFVGRKLEPWKDNEPFSDGVNHGFFGSRACHLVPLTNEIASISAVENGFSFDQFTTELEEAAGFTDPESEDEKTEATGIDKDQVCYGYAWTGM